MPIYLNGVKYVGGYMNGQRVNGYINGIKLFHYTAPFTIRYAPSGDEWYRKTVYVPSGKDYSIYDLEAYGIPSAFEGWNRTFHVNDGGFTYTVDPPKRADNWDTWPGELYKVSGNADAFPGIDNTGGGGDYTIYESPITKIQMYTRESGGMAGDQSTIDLGYIYYDTDGTVWYYGPCNTNNSSGQGGNGSTWVGTGWITTADNVNLTSKVPQNMEARLYGFNY